MVSFRSAILVTLIAVAGNGAGAVALQTQNLTPAQQGLAKLKALEGDWIDVEGAFGTKGALAVTYRVTSGGHSVVETFPVKTSFEMVTVYHLDGSDLMPAAVGSNSFWKQITSWVTGQSTQQTLDNIEASWPK